jgi:hypothetical protein
MPKKEQIERLEKINILIKFIADIDVKLSSPCSSFFFSRVTLKGNKDNYSRFEFKGEKLFFIDKYTEKWIYPYIGVSKARGFTEGGTLWGLVNDFRAWIVNGERSNGKNGYAGLYCPHWGGKWTLVLKDRVIEKAKGIGYLGNDSVTFSDYCKKLIKQGHDWMVKDYIDEVKKLTG